MFCVSGCPRLLTVCLPGFVCGKYTEGSLLVGSSFFGMNIVITQVELTKVMVKLEVTKKMTKLKVSKLEVTKSMTKLEN